jgi:hypothetical protein
MAKQNQGGDNEDVTLDLGVELDFSETNLFEAFHKAQAEDEDDNNEEDNADENEEDNENDDDNEDQDDDNNEEDDDEGDGKKGSTKKPIKKIKVSNDDVNDMVRGHLAAKGKTKTDDEEDDDTADDGKQGPKKTAASAGKKAAGLPEGVFKTVHDHFVNTLGYEPFSAEKPFDGKPESFEQWLAENEEAKSLEAAEDMIADAFANNPIPDNVGVAVDLFKFLRNGGKVADFVQTRKHDDLTPEYISEGKDDDEKTARAKKVMTAFYKSQGWKDERIDKTIKTLETGGSLLTIAEETLPEFIEQRDKQKAIIEKNNITAKKNQETAIKQFNSNLLSIIEKQGELGSFEFKSPKQKQALKEYMFMPTVELDNGKKVPQFMADLEKARQNPMFTLFQALLIKNKGLDLTNIEKKASDKTKGNIKTKFEQALSGGGRTEQTKNESTAGGGSSKNKTNRPTDFLNFDKLEFL